MKLRNILASFLILASSFLAACDSQTPATTTTAATLTTTTSSSDTTTLRQFTLSELAAFNGDGGTTAYIAVDGIVYDVTDAPEWNDGWHQDMHFAGTDATAAFAESPHSASVLAQLDIVGTLVD